MLQSKYCHQGLAAKTSYVGLEPGDLAVLFPFFYVVAAVFERPIIGTLMTVGGAVIIRIFKWGKLPGHTDSFITYILFIKEHRALGYDSAPPYPARIEHV